MGFLGLGTQELLVFVVVVLLLFGATALPKLARSLGRAQGEFKKARAEFTQEAAKAEGQAAKPEADEERLRRMARDLGIDEAGKGVPELKRLIQGKLA